MSDRFEAIQAKYSGRDPLDIVALMAENEEITALFRDPNYLWQRILEDARLGLAPGFTQADTTSLLKFLCKYDIFPVLAEHYHQLRFWQKARFHGWWYRAMLGLHNERPPH